MGKRHDYYRSRFIVEPQDSVMFGKRENVVAELRRLESISGIRVTVRELHDMRLPAGCFEVTTRTGIEHTAKLDHAFVKRVLEQDYGRLLYSFYEGRRFVRKREVWEQVEA